jgi:hypothetical protein
MRLFTPVKMHNKRLIFSTFAFFFLLGYAQAASAQLCQGSHIYLTIRDEHGSVIDPTPLSSRRRLTRSFDFVSVEGIKLAGSSSSGNASTKALVFSNDGCTFGALEEANLELHGRKMHLIFRNAKRVRDYSSFYTIDLLPFRQGTFEIDLSSPAGLISDPAELTAAGRGGSFTFSAAAWQEMSKAVPTFPGPHKIALRGTLVNGVTRQPMRGVKVELLMGRSGKEVYPVSSMTDAGGRFEIIGVPDEEIIASEGFSVRARAKGFAVTEVIINKHRQLAQTQARFDNISMELRPLVTVRGRLVDTKTGASPAVTPGTLEATALLDDTRTSGDYLMKIYYTAKDGIKADGHFTLVVAAGKNLFSLSDFQDYQRVAPGTRQELIDRYVNSEIKAKTQPEVVFRVRNANP